MTMLTVYVPSGATDLGIAPRSAIVGQPVQGSDELVLIDYEGGLYGQTRTYMAKLKQAAGRHTSRYPTVARALVPRRALVPVGTFDPATDDLVFTDPDAFDAWAWGRQRETAHV